MPRLTNLDGVTVNVSDETAELLGSDWSASEEKAKKAASKRS